MELTSGRFILFCIAIVVAANLKANARYRAVLMLCANCILIASYISAPVQVVGLVALLAVGYGCIEAVRRWQTWQTAAASIAAIVGLFVYLKHYAFVYFIPPLPFVYLTLGISYILFRIVHLVVDTSQGDLVERPNLLSYVNYTCNFLTFVSGPIQHYQDYEAELRTARKVDEVQAIYGFQRVVIGYFKVLFVSAIANAIFEKINGDVIGSGNIVWSAFCLKYIACAGVYTVFLYYNFSGYIDVVIGFARLIGWNIPENFNHPFKAANFLDFWGRWHMTLSHWFRDYMFNPLLSVLMGRFSDARLAQAIGVFGFFVTFLTMGVWHGATTVFIVYGLAMGAGASLNKAYQIWILGRIGRKQYRSLCRSPVYVYFCRGLTFAYFTIAVTALWVDFGQLLHIEHELGIAGGMVAFAGLTIVGAIALLGADILWGAVAWVSLALKPSGWGVAERTLGTACIIILTVAVNSLFHRPPEFVYRAF